MPLDIQNPCTPCIRAFLVAVDDYYQFFHEHSFSQKQTISYAKGIHTPLPNVAYQPLRRDFRGCLRPSVMGNYYHRELPPRSPMLGLRSRAFFIKAKVNTI